MEKVDKSYLFYLIQLHDCRFFTSLSPSWLLKKFKHSISCLQDLQKKGTVSLLSADRVVSGNFNVFRTEAVNYLSKPSSEPIKKCDIIDKLQALWQDPVCSFPVEQVKTTYVNDGSDNLNVNHYESSIRLRKISAASNSENDLRTPTNERPQSYIDMQGKKGDQEDLLLFNSSERDEDRAENTSELNM